mgnify:CR=1 FL=1
MAGKNPGVSRSTPQRKGEKRPADEKYRARVKVDGKEHFLGYFPSVAQAARRVEAFKEGQGRTAIKHETTKSKKTGRSQSTTKKVDPNV